MWPGQIGQLFKTLHFLVTIWSWHRWLIWTRRSQLLHISPLTTKGAVLGTGDILLRLVSATSELQSCPKMSRLKCESSNEKTTIPIRLASTIRILLSCVALLSGYVLNVTVKQKILDTSLSSIASCCLAHLYAATIVCQPSIKTNSLNYS